MTPKLNDLNRYFMWLFLRVAGCILVAALIALAIVVVGTSAK